MLNMGYTPQQFDGNLSKLAAEVPISIHAETRLIERGRVELLGQMAETIRYAVGLNAGPGSLMFENRIRDLRAAAQDPRGEGTKSLKHQAEATPPAHSKPAIPNSEQPIRNLTRKPGPNNGPTH